MNLLVAAFGLLLLGIASIGIANPRAVIGTMLGWEPRSVLWLAAGVRAVMGVILLLAAPECRHPTAVTVLGWIALVAAVALLLVGAEHLVRLMRWWQERAVNLARLSFGLAGVFGAWLLYTGLP